MRKLKERRKLLSKQIELLAKESEDGLPEMLPRYSREIVRLNRELNKPYVYLMTVGGSFLSYRYECSSQKTDGAT